MYQDLIKSVVLISIPFARKLVCRPLGKIGMSFFQVTLKQLTKRLSTRRVMTLISTNKK